MYYNAANELMLVIQNKNRLNEPVFL